MKILIKRMSLIIVVLIIAISVIIFYGYHSEIDFTDNPGLLEKIDENGTVYLDTYQGKVVGTLNKVKWKKEKSFSEKAKKIISKAQRGKVAYMIKDRNKITIWYQTTDGAVNLNAELRQLSD
ncbi:MAG: hypothetical protein WGN25_11315 [Candidatus Electrothrix sp. GW3-4]|uniref:hypothetical protein n=1 Tax=Candidatus Electrothrix sp. GW3-4 TaxID=3126740 RepID=UPI0030D3C2C4